MEYTMSDFDRSGEGWSGSIGGWCPVQGEGVVDGHPWYFRARGSGWSFDIAERGDADPVDVGIDENGWTTYEKWGKWPEAGYMPMPEAWAMIERSIALFRSGEMKRVPLEQLDGMRRRVETAEAAPRGNQ